MELGLLVIPFVLSAFGVWVFRRLAAGNSRLLDIPNERSSHSVPVPRGAGVAVVLTVLGVYIAAFGRESNFSYVIAATMIAIVSFLDDLYSTPPLLRLVVHFAAAVFFVFFSGSYIGISIPSADLLLQFGTIAPLLTIIFIVWTINAFNFMDGIDGLAGMQGTAAGLGWLFFGIVSGNFMFVALGAIVAGACAGFLIFNWPPAKVFLGDVGSTFLGFTFAVFPLVLSPSATSRLGSDLTLAVVLIWLFQFDTAFTRLRLLIRGGTFWKAHREHLYQRVVGSRGSHLVVALFFGIYSGTTAVALGLAPKIGMFPLTALLLAGPISLFLWARTSDSA